MRKPLSPLSPGHDSGVLENLLEREGLAPVVEDYNRVEEALAESIRFSLEVIPQVVHYLVDAGGKRIRPIVHCLAARLCGYEGEEHILLAAVSEMVHSATLFHDDVIDDGEVRRGLPAAKTVWGNKTSVLTGDFLFTRAYGMMMNHGHYEIAGKLAPTVEDLVRGELIQLAHTGNPAIRPDEYMEIIRCKTASLFSWCGRAAAMIAGHPEERANDLGRFGHLFGLAFQITDDILDYTGSAEATGKENHSDLAEGKITLPLILAIENDRSILDDLHSLLESDSPSGSDALRALAQRVTRSGSIERSRRIAEGHVAEAIQALQPFPPSPFRDALADLARIILSRTG